MEHEELYQINKKISPFDSKAEIRARKKWDTLAKPLGGLGRLEDIICDIAGISGSEVIELKKPVMYVCCADNGVISEGISQCKNEGTTAVAKALARGKSTVNYMAQGSGLRIIPVDAGILDDLKEYSSDLAGGPGIIDMKVRRGTGNIAIEAAMTEEEAVKTIKNGIMLTKKAKEEGCDILLTGEMGIGNTTTSSALTAYLTEMDPGEVTGRGAGLSDESLQRKKDVVRRAVERARHSMESLHKSDNNYYIKLLAELGGLDIGMITGICIGGGLYDLPVIVDGFITMTAALLAIKITPACKKSLIGSHTSAESGVQALIRHLGIKPFIDAGMRLGEGTGAVAALKVLQSALSVYNSGHTFDNIGIEAYKCL